MSKFILLCLVVVSLSSCASYQVAENGCKFVNGAHESEQERKKNNERNRVEHVLEAEVLVVRVLHEGMDAPQRLLD